MQVRSQDKATKRKEGSLYPGGKAAVSRAFDWVSKSNLYSDLHFDWVVTPPEHFDWVVTPDRSTETSFLRIMIGLKNYALKSVDLIGRHRVISFLNLIQVVVLGWWFAISHTRLEDHD